jgi:hypothetical protein
MRLAAFDPLCHLSSFFTSLAIEQYFGKEDRESIPYLAEQYLWRASRKVSGRL